MHRFLIGIVGIGLMLGAASAYEASIHAWQKERDARLRAPDGWLTLVGLFWLHEGKKTIGSAADNDFVLPKTAAPHVGTLQLEQGKVSFTDAHGQSRALSFDENKPDIVTNGSVSFYVIRRGDKFAVRAKDSQSQVLRQFTGMKYFPVNPALRFEATLIPDAKKVPIVNILGQTELQESPGVAEFRYRGQTYRLRPIYEDTPQGKTLFCLFKDPTNRTATYQAGRMLNTPLPKDGKFELDFNKAYNPPCTFTPYATCPLPPRENTLPFAVTAGELRYGHGHPELTAQR